jgi:hypothetical protein
MRPRFRSILILTVIIGLTVGLLVLLSRWVVPLDPGLGRVPEWYRQIREEEKRGAKIDRLLRPQVLASLIKARVARKLVEGQITLRQAVGINRYLHEALPLESMKWLPGDTPEEQYGRNVLASVRAEHRYFPATVPMDVVERLEAELQKLLAGPGGWILEVSPETIAELCSASR